jgi:hypothetical protein
VVRAAALWHAEIRLPRQEEGRRGRAAVGVIRGSAALTRRPAHAWHWLSSDPRVDASAPQRVARMLDVGHFLGLRAVRPAGQAGAAAAQPNIFTRERRSIAVAGHFSGMRIAALFAVLSAIASIPILLYPWPPLGDYINHLSRMHVIATINRDPDLTLFYEVHWQVIPNLMMDLIVPILQRAMNVYLAGQVYTIMTFVLILSGTLALNRQLYGHWSVLPLIAFPLLYNSVFLVGTMNYLFGIGLALWALAAWAALREHAMVLGWACQRCSCWRCSSATCTRSGSTGSACSRSSCKGCWRSGSVGDRTPKT